MKLIEFLQEHAQPIELFERVSASSRHLADGSGAAHVYCVYFSPGGKIGEHRGSSLEQKVAEPSMLGTGCPNRHVLPLTASPIAHRR